MITTFKYNRNNLVNTLLDNLEGMAYCNLYDKYWTMIFVSEGSKGLTGYTPQELVNNKRISYEQIIFKDDRNNVRNVIDEACKLGTRFELEYRICHANGSVIWVCERGTPIYNDEGEIEALEGYIHNITERKIAEQALRNAETRYHSIFENAIEGIFQTTPTGQYLVVNSALARIYGYSSTEELLSVLNNIKHQLYVSPHRRDEFVQAMAATGSVLNFESLVYKKDQSTIWISENSHMVHDESGKLLYYEGTVQDVTDIREMQEALKVSERKTKQSLEELKYQKFALDKHAIVAVTDIHGQITYANDKFCEISGYLRNELMGQNHIILNSGYHPKGFFKKMYITLSNGEVWHDEICNRSKEGNLYWVDITVAPYIGDDGITQSYISICTDITQRVTAEEQSNYLALYDPLTSLANRRLLLDRLSQALASSARSGRDGAILFIDLDHFKMLNDTLGHEVGDLLLQQVATRLTSCVREGDTVARLGGDEFVVLLECLSEESIISASDAEAIGDKILASLNMPFQLSSDEYQSTASIGITIFNDHNQTQEELLKHADIAMYQAKKAGRNSIRFFDHKMQDAIDARVSMERDLHKALENHEFQLYYQVQVDSVGQPLGAEALIRWIHPQRGIVSPFHFIPLAEETGVILPIGQWVLETACAQLKIWEQNALTCELTISVNVSAKQFNQPDFVTQVKAVIQNHAINPALLKLELTESMLLNNIEHIIINMVALQTVGVRFELDDFGTGYSSLQYLKKLPLQQLKIDQSFVNEIDFDKSDQAIVRTIIAMARGLNLDVIAEGVESDSQLAFLVNYGCKRFQGYFFGKPVSIEQFETALMRD
jgi:diguanylate cyclase (GGDEF)-like protein/PAS domain S-box-containing protein